MAVCCESSRKTDNEKLLMTMNDDLILSKVNMPSSVEEFLDTKWGQAAKAQESLQKILDVCPVILAKLENGEGRVAVLARSARVMYGLLRQHLSGEKGLSARNVLMVIAALLYLISPADVIPDFIPLIGWLDDLMILSMVLERLLPQLKEGGIQLVRSLTPKSVDELLETKWGREAMQPGSEQKILDALPDLLRELESGGGSRPELARHAEAIYDLLRRHLSGERPLTERQTNSIKAALLYLLAPVDIIPDVLPVLGWEDDMIIITLVKDELAELLEIPADEESAAPAV